MLRVYRYMYIYIYTYMVYMYIGIQWGFRVKLLESPNMMKRYWRYWTPWVAEGEVLGCGMSDMGL